MIEALKNPPLGDFIIEMFFLLREEKMGAKLLDKPGTSIVTYATLCKSDVDKTTIYIVDHPTVLDLVASRDIVGSAKRQLYQDALVATLAFGWREVAIKEGILKPMPIVSLLRGGEMIRPPDNLSGIMGHPVHVAGLKVERFQNKNEGCGWSAVVDEKSSYSLGIVGLSETVAILDECIASGANGRMATQALLARFPDIKRFVYICPFASDFGVKQIVKDIYVPVVFFTFGVFHVMSEGWKKPYTDIVVAKQQGLLDANDPYYLIPDSILNVVGSCYGFKNDRTMCLVGDATKTMDDDRYMQITQLIEAAQEWLVFNGTNPSKRLFENLKQLLVGIPDQRESELKKKTDAMLQIIDRIASTCEFNPSVKQLAELWLETEAIRRSSNNN